VPNRPEPPALNIRVSSTDTTAVYDVAGEIDLATAPELAAALTTKPHGVQHVIVNLTEVSFIDSSGLKTLVEYQGDLTRRHITLQVVSPPTSHVHRVLELTNLINALGVIESLQAALKQ
jgi:anti-sigma B factor antagonist